MKMKTTMKFLKNQVKELITTGAKCLNKDNFRRDKVQPTPESCVLSLQNANAAVERSLSDNKNTLTKEWIGLLPETFIGLRRMKEYARHKGGSHCIVFTQNMLEEMKEAKKKNDERILEKHKAEEEVRQKLKEDADKKKNKRQC